MMSVLDFIPFSSNRSALAPTGGGFVASNTHLLTHDSAVFKRTTVQKKEEGIVKKPTVQKNGNGIVKKREEH